LHQSFLGLPDGLCQEGLDTGLAKEVEKRYLGELCPQGRDVPQGGKAEGTVRYDLVEPVRSSSRRDEE
jgi:hypothetical protein